ncbi:hypothetical protein [Gorillibacterium timonense]|uniref:hypothetical protein n=1 Tax=Gorillibacterium timonense TaxID=1689269 RepID=UPI00071CF014|nr:hypothetical protein [Gorillibacterium timonense]
MAAKKTPVKPNHIHIPADPLRIRLEEIQARQSGRRQQGLKSGEVTNETLYEMIADILESQMLIEARLQSIARGK